MTIPHHASAINPNQMQINPTLTQTSGPQHFLSSPALASPTGSAGNSAQRPCEQQNLSTNGQCPTVFVTNMGHYLRESENKDYSR